MAWDAELYFANGFIARGEGRKRDENPHPRGTSAWMAWLSGWEMRSQTNVTASAMASLTKASAAD